jgi:hypothetical protein
MLLTAVPDNASSISMVTWPPTACIKQLNKKEQEASGKKGNVVMSQCLTNSAVRHEDVWGS